MMRARWASLGYWEAAEVVMVVCLMLLGMLMGTLSSVFFVLLVELPSMEALVLAVRSNVRLL